MKKHRSTWLFLILVNIISTSRKGLVAATSVAYFAERLKSLLRFRDLLIISVLLFGCSLYVSRVETVQPSMDINVSETVYAVIATPIETIVTATQVTSLTPLATLPPDDALGKLLELYDNNGGCELPCWWGITPGMTTWKEAYERLAPLGYVASPLIHENITRYEFEFTVPTELSSLGYFWPELVVKNDVVTAISINSSYIERDFDFSLSGILKTFGVPEEIWIKPTVESMTNVPFYEIRLFYPAKGVLISANGDAEIKDNLFIICPNEFKLDIYPPSIVLWSSQQKVEFNDFGLSVLGNLTWDTNGYYQLKNLTTEFNEKNFYNVYINPVSEGCFALDVNKIP